MLCPGGEQGGPARLAASRAGQEAPAEPRCGRSLRFPRCCQHPARGGLTREAENPATPAAPAEPASHRGHEVPPVRAARRDPPLLLPVSPKHPGCESPSRFSRPQAGVNHGPARRQGRSRRHRRCVPEPRLSAAPVQGDQGFAVDPRTCKLLPQASKCTQGFAQPQQPTPGHPGSHQHGHRARDPTRDSVLAAGDGVCAGRPTLQGTRAPQGVTASPVAWVPAPAPPRPSAGWEPQTEIPPVAARPAPVTRGTRRSGYTSRTRRQTRHSSAGTGAPAPTTAPRAGTAVPRCHRHCSGAAGAGSLDLEGAGSATSAQRCPGQPRTAGQPRSTVGTTPRHCPPMQGGTSPAPTPQWDEPSVLLWGEIVVPRCPVPVPPDSWEAARQPLTAAPGCF